MLELRELVLDDDPAGSSQAAGTDAKPRVTFAQWSACLLPNYPRSNEMKVLLATDGSTFSEAAVDRCCKIFEQVKGTEMRVLTVIEPSYIAAQPFAVFPN